MASQNHGFPLSCMSAGDHLPTERNHMVHYFGCLEFCQRKAYFQTLDDDVKEQIKTELRRVKFLRDALKKDRDEVYLVHEFEAALGKWKDAKINKLGEVKTWRMDNGKPNNADHFNPNAANESKQTERPEYDADMDTNARVIMFGKPDGFDFEEPNLKGKFPNQKIQVSKLLDPKDNTSLLHKSRHKSGMVRYFHLPTNNMKWAEKAIHQYFGDTASANKLLRPQFWEGQQRGGGPGSVHPRHLRPMCEMVCTDPKEVGRDPKSIVLFMPYLHWEMDRRRQNFAAVIDKAAERYQKERIQDEESNKAIRREYRESLTLPNGKAGKDMKRYFYKESLESQLQAPARTFTAVCDKFEAEIERRKKKSDRKKGSKSDKDVSKSSLGRLLFSAAMLCEAMSNFKDKKLLEKYVHQDPPLHPRNTLDQVYYWALRNTNKRDKDQVLYRGTRALPERLHRYDPKTKRWPCFDNADSDKNEKASNKYANMGRVCEQCTENARKVARVVMVDQLWMWVLDEHTIITCFPKRYGHNREDQSGVNKAIRVRLGNVDPKQINSAFDVAFIIVDECCRMFFDRSKTRYLQPQVMDIFSEAIGMVTHRQTVSFDHLWIWAEKLAGASSTKASIDLSALHAPLININPEGILQREIKDILDELGIMLFIIRKQRDVVTKFKKHVENVLEPGHQPATTLSKGYNWLVSCAEDLLTKVDGYLEELEGLKLRADATSTSLDHLLGLKQQQAGVVQAWQSIRHAEAAVTQGHAIVMFTILTVVFLPLAFVAAVFGMNNEDFEGDKLTFHRQLELMVEVSVPIIAVVVVIAFSKLVRAAVWSLSALVYTWVGVTFGVYGWWLNIHHNWSSDNIVKRTEISVHKMKEEVRNAILKNRANELQEQHGWAFGSQEKKTTSQRSGSQSNSRTTEPETDIESQSTISRRRNGRVAE